MVNDTKKGITITFTEEDIKYLAFNFKRHRMSLEKKIEGAQKILQAVPLIEQLNDLDVGFGSKLDYNGIQEVQESLERDLIELKRTHSLFTEKIERYSILFEGEIDDMITDLLD